MFPCAHKIFLNGHLFAHFHQNRKGMNRQTYRMCTGRLNNDCLPNVQADNPVVAHVMSAQTVLIWQGRPERLLEA